MPESHDNNADSGFACLVLLLRFHSVPAEPEQIGHRLGGAVVDIPDMLRCALTMGPQGANRREGLVAVVGGVPAGDRAAQGRHLPDPWPRCPRHGAGAGYGGRPAAIGGARRIRGAMDRTAGGDGAPRFAVGTGSALRHHPVPAGHARISWSIDGSAGRLVLSAGVRANLAAVLPGRDRPSSTGASRAHHVVLRAPVDGTVQQLAVHTVGGVVTPAQQLMAIVPADSRLEAEAMIENRDIGFVVPGQSAQVKIDTFNFTKYGLLHGAVVTVSQDAIARDKPVDPANKSKSRAALSDTSDPQGQELVYSARISLDRTEMLIEEKTVSLAPGMAVTVEIKTGQRRVIEYLLSPLLRYRHEAIRERRAR
jgi:HlyD family secretion protein